MDQDPHVKDRATTGLYMMYGSILGRFGVLIVPDPQPSGDGETSSPGDAR
ncbi:hypothetical protein ACKTEK_02575 [Tepidamorphus sp. 3E244]